MNMEFLGLKTAMANGDDGEMDEDEQDAQVEEMERMTARLNAIKGDIITLLFNLKRLTI